MIICCNNGREGLAGGTDVLRVFHPCGSREEGNTHNLQEFSQGLNLVDEVEHSRNRVPTQRPK